MGVFRSEKMLLCQILFSQETVFDCIEVLGKVGLVQFRDLNAAVAQHQRRYVGDVRRCEEMERKIRVLEEEVRKSQIPIGECKEIPSAPGSKEMLWLESNLETLVAEIGNVNNINGVLKRNLFRLIEKYHVVRKASAWLRENQLVCDEERQERFGDKEKAIEQLKITTGVILVEKIKSFEMLVWRICRGVVFVRMIHIAQSLTDPDTDLKVKKAVFVIICQGDKLNSKVRKICEAFHCSIYLDPTSAARSKELEREILDGIRDTQQVMQQTGDHRRRVIAVAAASIEKWRLQVLKLKSIFHVMNMLQVDDTNEFQVAECWVPQSDLQSIRLKLNGAAERKSNRNDPIIIVKPHCERPPTFNRTNKFTKGFQTLVDSYGISDYCEVNPMPFTVITFPFLFALMFGDVGHGTILTIFATFMVLYEKKLSGKKIKGEIQRIFFEGRYVILLMGFFSCYTGLIYNDFFSKSIRLFASSWLVKHNESALSGGAIVQLNPSSDFTGRPYVFGMDPIWQCSKNKIIFLNSFKMKISIIFGVLQMCFGMVLSVGNHLYFGEYYNIYAKLVPEIIYFASLFVYLVFLIIAKWLLYGPLYDTVSETRCAPNILMTFINMVTFKRTAHPVQCLPYIYPNQGLVQTVLVTLALVSVPWLFAAQTSILLHHRKMYSGKGAIDDDASKVSNVRDDKGIYQRSKFDVETTDAGEIIIHQGIRTAEFVLGSISHTASYLRLWALSLAHAQLSDLLWKMVLRVGIGARGHVAGLSITICFAIWATLTVSILVAMEGLSAFLHTLRLHWVEFQSKFYSGSGQPFKPFSFEKIFDLDGDSESFE